MTGKIAKKFLLVTLLLCFTLVGEAFSYYDSCRKEYPESGESVIADGCYSTPEDWAIAALSDALSFGSTDQDKHFGRVKNAYFSENGWSEFMTTLRRSRIPEMLAAKKWELIAINLYKKDVKIITKKMDDNHASIHISIPMLIIYRPDDQESGRVTRKDSLIFNFEFAGPVNLSKYISTDTSGRIRQYDYRIQTFKAMVGKSIGESATQAKPQNFWRRFFQ